MPELNPNRLQDSYERGVSEVLANLGLALALFSIIPAVVGRFDHDPKLMWIGVGLTVLGVSPTVGWWFWVLVFT